MIKVQESQNLHPIVYGPQGQEFILIPAGPFLMGSTEEELKYLAKQWGDPTVIQKAHLNLEMPQHEVSLAAYYIGKHPVTNAEWQAFVDAGGYQNTAYWSDPEVLRNLRKKTPWYWPDPKWSQPNHPVVGIGWDDCVAYCKWLSGAMGRTVRLLTEAEWEKAAGWDEKRKEKRRFPWGDEWDSSRCNSLDSGNLRTTPVGQYSPAGDSPHGIADMVGNVSEYCSTLFSDAGLSHFKEYPYPYQQDDGREDITSTLGGYFGGSHIQRGGNWDMQWLGCRCSFRQTVKRGIVNNGIGVRVGFSAGLTDEGVSEHTGDRMRYGIEGVNEWIVKHAVDLAALAWDSYQEKGRGMVIVFAQTAKPGEPWYTGAQFGYLDQATMKQKPINKDDLVTVREYDPVTEFLVMVLQPNSGTVKTVRPELPPPQAYEQNKHHYKERLASM
jgi:formylglycine-generating enzyme required for sulfatase activity